MDTTDIIKNVIAFERADARLFALIDLKQAVSEWATEDVLRTIDAHIRNANNRAQETMKSIKK